MNEIMFADGLISEEELEHYGIPRRSGRYPWGSGENPYHHGASSPFGKVKLSDKQKKAIKIGAAAAGTALAVVGAVYLAKSGRLDELAEIGSAVANRTLAKIGEKSVTREIEKEIIKDRKTADRNRRKLSDEELVERIGRLKKEKELRDLTREDLYSGKKDIDEVLTSAGKKILTGAVSGAGLVATEYLIRRYLSNEMSEEELAKAVKEYMRPKKK